MDKGGQEMQDHGTFLLPGFYIPHEKLNMKSESTVAKR